MTSTSAQALANFDEAYQEYRRNLPLEERAKLPTQSSTPISHESRRSVKYVAVEIDQKSRKDLSGRVKPKLLSFLYSVKDYTRVLDTYAQANSIAAVIWGSVKLCLLLTCNWASYFEALTEILSSVGDVSHRFREYESLFPTSEGLQNALVEYHAGVIRICTKAVHDVQLPRWQQTAKITFKSFESEYNPLQLTLAKTSTAVKDWIGIASAKVQRDEAEYNKAERAKTDEILAKADENLSLIKLLRPDASKELLNLRDFQVSKYRQETKANLSTINMTAEWRRIKRQSIEGIYSWFESNNDYKSWKSATTSSLLLYKANIGCGKTYLFSDTINNLVEDEGTEHAIGYFMGQTRELATLTARQIIGCIARQLLEPLIDAADHAVLTEIHHKSRSRDIDDIVDLMIEHLPSNKQCYILLDGLDELAKEERHLTVEAVFDVFHHAKCVKAVKVFVTTRRDPSSLRVKLKAGSVYVMQPTMEERKAGIADFVVDAIEEKVDLKELPLYEESLGTIISHVEEGAQGMYLWARLIIENLCLCDSEREVLRILDEMSTMSVPIQLAQIYDRILMRLESDESRYGELRRVFAWAIGAKRPLTRDQMQEAISIDVGQKQLGIKTLRDISRAISKAGGLVVIDPDNDTIQLVHSSFAEHVFARAPEISCRAIPERPRLHFSRDTLDLEILEHCATYLSLPCFEESLVPAKDSHVAPPSPDSIIPMASGDVEKPPSKIEKARKLFSEIRRARKSPQVSSEQCARYTGMAYRRLTAAAPDTSTPWKPTLVSYAGRYWIDHAAHIKDTTSSEVWLAFIQLVYSTGRHVERPWETDYGRPDALEASKSPRASAALKTPSEYFSTSYYSSETLALLRWAFNHNNATLIAIIDLEHKGKRSDSKKLSEGSICNTLSSVINLLNESSPQSRAMLCRVLHTRLLSIDPESAFIRIIDWYAAALFDWAPSKIAFPTGWRQDCFSASRVGDLTGIESFTGVNLSLSATAKRERLGSFDKHKTWMDFGDKEILIHPMILAVILGHSKAVGWMQGTLKDTDNADPFAAGIDPFDLILDSLRYGLICDRREICHRLMDPIESSSKPPLAKKAWRVARVLMGAQLRGYVELAERLLVSAVREDPQQLLEEVIDCRDDAKNSLLFYLVDSRDLSSLSILLAHRDDTEKIKSPMTANGADLHEFTKELIDEVGPTQSSRAIASLQDIRDLIAKNFSNADTEKKPSTTRKNSFGDELKSFFSRTRTPPEVASDSDQEEPSSSSPGQKISRPAAHERLLQTTRASADSLDPPTRSDMAALEALIAQSSPPRSAPADRQLFRDSSFGHIDTDPIRQPQTPPRSAPISQAEFPSVQHPGSHPICRGKDDQATRGAQQIIPRDDQDAAAPVPFEPMPQQAFVSPDTNKTDVDRSTIGVQQPSMNDDRAAPPVGRVFGPYTPSTSRWASSTESIETQSGSQESSRGQAGPVPSTPDASVPKRGNTLQDKALWS